MHSARDLRTTVYPEDITANKKLKAFDDEHWEFEPLMYLDEEDVEDDEEIGKRFNYTKDIIEPRTEEPKYDTEPWFT